MDQRQQYRDFCQLHYVPLQMQPWWLDAVCGVDNWQVSLAQQADGSIIGALPYYLVRRWGLRFIKMPPLTDYAGPLILYPQDQTQTLPNQYAHEKKVLKQLIAGLPKVHFFNQQWYPDFDYGLPLVWAGFRLRPYYTYRIGPDGGGDAGGSVHGSSVEKIHEFSLRVKGSVRTDTRKAQQHLRIIESNDIQKFIQLHKQSFARQNLALPYPPAVLQRLDGALRSRGQCRLLLTTLKDSEEPVAGLYTVWDQQTAYLLMCAVTDSARPLGALQWLYQEAIQQLVGKVQYIDFCGSMIESVERTTRAFGPRRAMHLRVYKTANKALRLLALLTNKDYL